MTDTTSKAKPSATSEFLDGMAERLGGCRLALATPGVPPRYAVWTLATYPESWCLSVLPFIAGEIDTLYIYGEVGSRKTSFAAAVLKAWRWVRPVPPEPWRDPTWVSAYTLVDTMRKIGDGFATEDRERWEITPLLVLDDLGAGRDTPHVVEQTLFLLQRRYDTCKQTLVTSNLDLDKLGSEIDPRAASRLQAGLVKRLEGKDWRAKETREKKGDDHGEAQEGCAAEEGREKGGRAGTRR